MRPTALASLVALAPAVFGAAPTTIIEPWAPRGISSDQFESHAAFDPRTGELYFVRSNRDFVGWRILTSHCGVDGWSAPVDAPFAGDGVEADPWFTPDGNTIYFILTRSTDGVHREDLDIWRVERDYFVSDSASTATAITFW